VSLRKTQKRHLLLRLTIILLSLTLLGIWQIKAGESKKLPVAPTATPAFQDFHLLIPKIQVEAPIIADVDGADKEAYFKALEGGVAHFKGTAKPGEGSNIFIFGHSSFYLWSPGNYKEIFRHLEDLAVNDEIILWYQQKEYQYQVTEMKVVEPEEVEFINPTKEEQLTLMTCVPPGTTLKRLIVIGKPKM